LPGLLYYVYISQFLFDINLLEVILQETRMETERKH